MKIKAEDLTSAALDWAVAKCEGGAKAGNQNAIGNAGWRKGGITAKYVKDKSCE